LRRPCAVLPAVGGAALFRVLSAREAGRVRIMAPGGASTARFDPMSKVDVFTPPRRCR
jgi:hypothetical protein